MGLVGGDDVAAVGGGVDLVGAQADFFAEGGAFDGAARASEHIVSGVALGAESLEVGGVDAQRHIGAVLDGAREVVGQRFVSAGGDIKTLDDQHAAVASVGVGSIVKVAGQLLLTVEDDIFAHAVHPVGRPQGIGAQIDAHREVGHYSVVDLVASGEHDDACCDGEDVAEAFHDGCVLFVAHKCSD